MRKILLLCSLFYGLNSIAQDSSLNRKITKTHDDFNNTTTYITPMRNDCVILKHVKGKVVSYTLALTSYGSSVVVDGEGVKIILSNGKMLSYPKEKIKVDVGGNAGYIYRAFINLHAKDFETLKKEKIIKWQLYIFNNQQSDNIAEDIKAMANNI